MKIYVTDKRVTLVGKAWQIKALLKQYKKKYKTVQQWCNHTAKG